jgi:hypothetical protein
LRIGGTPAEYGCLKCWLQSNGKCNGQGKTIYNGSHYTMLPPKHPLRKALYQLHNPKDDQRAKEATSSLRYRSHREVMEHLREPPATPLLAPGEEVCTFPGCSHWENCNVAKEPRTIGTVVAGAPAAPAPLPVAANMAARVDDNDSGSDHSSDSGGMDKQSDDGHPRRQRHRGHDAAQQHHDSPNPMGRLRYFNFLYMILIDAMHTMGGVLKDLCKLFQGLKEQPNVDAYELQHNNRVFGSAHRASK